MINKPTAHKTSKTRLAAIALLDAGAVTLPWSSAEAQEFWRLEMQRFVKVVWPDGLALSFGGAPIDNNPAHQATFVRCWNAAQ